MTSPAHVHNSLNHEIGRIESLDINPKGDHMMTVDLDGVLHLPDIQTNSCIWNKTLNLINRGGKAGKK